MNGGRHVVVVGGGLAGVAAATVLAERGVAVTLVEREAVLGGRAASFPDRLADGTPFEMERGFHAFFRHYANLRALLRRVDPGLGMLAPLEDYPILGPDGAVERFAGLPTRTPWNLIALVRRTPTLRLRDLARVDVRQALRMLTFDSARRPAALGAESARAYLDSLRFPPRARRMLFEVFAHSFFHAEEELSAAELLEMFHFYFLANPEGLVFDVARVPFGTAIWQPLARRLAGLGARLLVGERARRISRAEGAWRVETERGPLPAADAVVIALSVPALHELVAASPDVGDPAWRSRVLGLRVTRPFAVWRLWLDRPLAPERAPFAGTAGLGILDNVSLYDRFQSESAAWARRSGGAVVELHAYGLSEGAREDAVRAELLGGLHAVYPETRAARILEERFLVRADCPAFPPGEDARPGVTTPSPGLVLAGDFVRLPIPSALMERAVASGLYAANQLLEGWGAPPEPIQAVAGQGILAIGRPLVTNSRARGK